MRITHALLQWNNCIYNAALCLEITKAIEMTTFLNILFDHPTYLSKIVIIFIKFDQTFMIKNKSL